MKCFVVLAGILGMAAAFPMPDEVYRPGPPPSQYKPLPYNPKEEQYDPQPYQFQYGISDQYTGANYKAIEQQDQAGTVIGSYSVNLPDGRVQTVTYKADEKGGFVADVSYEGEAIFPPEPAEGYGNSYKKNANYKAAPPKYANAPPPQYKSEPVYKPAPKKYAPAPPSYPQES